MRSRAHESYYPAVPFHAVRFLSLLSCVVVSGILTYFCITLKQDGFKLPWVLLIVLATVLGTLVYLALSWCIHLCGTLSPLFSLILNIPILLVWIGAFAFFTYNIYGTLGHSCSRTNWGNSSGVKICNFYKILYSFMLFGLLSHVALIVLDVRAMRAQKSQGIYNRMDEDSKDNLKLDTFDATTGYTPERDVPYGVDPGRADDIPHPGNTTRHSTANNPTHGLDPYQHTGTSYRSSRQTFLGETRPGLYSREASSHQSARSDVPMLSSYGARWAEQQHSAYSSPRHGSPRRY